MSLSANIVQRFLYCGGTGDMTSSEAPQIFLLSSAFDKHCLLQTQSFCSEQILNKNYRTTNNNWLCERWKLRQVFNFNSNRRRPAVLDAQR